MASSKWWTGNCCCYSSGEPPDIVDCGNCSGDTAPRVLCVVLDGFINSGPTDCQTCWRGTWRTQFQGSSPDPEDPDIDCCVWLCGTIDSGGPTCVAESVTVYLCYDPNADNYFVRVELDLSGVGKVTWRKDYGATPPDCLTFSNESIPRISDDTGQCDSAGSTCLITSVAEAANTDCCGDGCYPSSWPRTIDLIFAGFGSGDEGDGCCDECENWNGTWTLEQENYGLGSGNCGWSVPVIPPICLVDTLRLKAGNTTIDFYSAGIIIYQLAIATPDRADFFTSPDCINLDETIVYDDLGTPLNAGCRLFATAILGNPPCAAMPPETECCDPNNFPISGALPCRGTLAARCTGFPGSATVTFQGGPARDCVTSGSGCEADCCDDTSLPGTLTATVAGITGGGSCAFFNGSYSLTFDTSTISICGGDGPTHGETHGERCKWSKLTARPSVLTMSCEGGTITLDFYLYSCNDFGVPPNVIHWQGTTTEGCAFDGVVLSYVSSASACGAGSSTVTINA